MSIHINSEVLYLTAAGAVWMAATLLTLVLIRKTVIVNEAFRTGTGEIVDSIDARASIVAWRRAARVEVYITVLALKERESKQALITAVRRLIMQRHIGHYLMYLHISLQRID